MMLIYIYNDLEGYGSMAQGELWRTLSIRTFTLQTVWFKSGTEVQSNMMGGLLCKHCYSIVCNSVLCGVPQLNAGVFYDVVVDR